MYNSQEYCALQNKSYITSHSGQSTAQAENLNHVDKHVDQTSRVVHFLCWPRCTRLGRSSAANVPETNGVQFQ